MVKVTQASSGLLNEFKVKDASIVNPASAEVVRAKIEAIFNTPMTEAAEKAFETLRNVQSFFYSAIEMDNNVKEKFFAENPDVDKSGWLNIDEIETVLKTLDRNSKYWKRECESVATTSTELIEKMKAALDKAENLLIKYAPADKDGHYTSEERKEFKEVFDLISSLK